MLALFPAPKGLAQSDPAALLDKPKTPPAELPLVRIAPGVFMLGKVTLDKTQRTVSFPASVNQRRGMVEYAVVTFAGKTHESVFKTEAQPKHIHTALLLLGAEPASTNAFPNDPFLPLPGEKVSIAVHWEQEGKRLSKPLEDFIVTTNNQKTLTPGPWIYNGSFVIERQFTAQVDGSIISIHTDPVALINNPRRGRENDDLQQVNGAALPDDDVQLQITIHLAKERPSAPASPPLTVPGNRKQLSGKAAP